MRWTSQAAVLVNPIMTKDDAEDSARMGTQITLDCRGLKCPLPIVRLSLAVREIDIGDTILIQANDLAFEPDLRAWADLSSQVIVSFATGDDHASTAVIKKVTP